jgi:hypothetical protein
MCSNTQIFDFRKLTDFLAITSALPTFSVACVRVKRKSVLLIKSCRGLH